MPTLSFDDVFTVQALISLLTLTGLEIVLGIDNVIFIAILVGRLPAEMRDRARKLGLFLAMFMRIALLFCITWVMGLERWKLFKLPWDAHQAAEPGAHGPDTVHAAGALPAVVDAAAQAAEAAANWFTGRDLVLFLGGLFLIAKSVYEIHHKIEDAGEPSHHEVTPLPREGAPGGPVQGGYVKKAGATFGSVIVQILMLDLVFSLDSVITAVGMAKQVVIMIAAVVISIAVMLAFSGVIARFVDKHPTIKMLALSFLILIGVMLVADSTGWHVPKAYIYCSMAFALGVEVLNILVRSRSSRAGRPAAH